MEQIKNKIGLIGLGVMGSNLARNIARHDWSISVYNRTAATVDNFMAKYDGEGTFSGFSDLSAFVSSLESPRKIVLMINAGSAVDLVMDSLYPLLDKGDIIIDGGNSNFEDSNRRVKIAEGKGFYFVGCGISGGEEGALTGPSMMPGGSFEAWNEVKEIITSIAAKTEDGSACCSWIGSGGSGHFVKMIHNGIEYGDMQLIAEAYWTMKNIALMGNEEIADVFDEWNKHKLQSYLVEISASVMRHKNDNGGYLIDDILDVAGQKGTGKWSVMNAMDLGMPLGLIATAVFERNISAQKDVRVAAAKLFVNDVASNGVSDKKAFVDDLYNALYASKLVSYAQGFAVLTEASKIFDWNLNLSGIAKLWREGCIIRSRFLNDIANAYDNEKGLENLLMSEFFSKEIMSAMPAWKRVVMIGVAEELPLPAFSSAWNYFLDLRSENIPANMIQGLRDFFGAHTFEMRNDKRNVFHHANWY